MDAHKALISSIFNNSTLIEVPFFQRSYVWKEDLWSRFLEDMEFVSKTGKPHFFGSIILKETRKRRRDDPYAECKTIVDGQQRLTTFIIFMKALCLLHGQTVFFDSQFRILGQMIALRHGRNDIEAFEKVVSTTKAEVIAVPERGSRVIDAFNYFIGNIRSERLNIMTIITNAQFVRIDLDADEDEQQIFDTINSLGVTLTTSELLKNYFFSRETVNEYTEKWEAIFERDDETKLYWEHEIETGRIKRAMIDIFFDAFFQLFIQNRTYNISNEDKLMYARVDNLAQSYQHFIANYCNGDKQVVLGEMSAYAECFRRNFQFDQCDRAISASFGIERLNVIIFGLKNSTLIPYVLYLAYNVGDGETLNRMYGVLESYVMRRIVTHATTKNYNNLFTSLILNRVLDVQSLVARLRRSDDATTYIPADEELQQGFENAKLVNAQSKGILYMLESKIRPSSSSLAMLGYNSYSLEHLMPKKWRNNWPACENAEAARRRDAALLTLGNLAIITQSLNASIRDAAWDVKKEGKGTNKPGLKLCAGGLATLFDALACETWNEDRIAERAHWLFEHARRIWRVESAESEQETNEDERGENTAVSIAPVSSSMPDLVLIKAPMIERCYNALESRLGSVDFKAGPLWDQEGYKYDVIRKGRAIMAQAGDNYYKSGGEALGIVPEGLGGMQNLVDWRDVSDYYAAGHVDQVESGLRHLFTTDDDKTSFNMLRSALGNKYAIITYFFFLKSSKEYAVMRPDNFVRRLGMVGASANCTTRCTWENYRAFLSILREVHSYLLTKNESTTFLDAHSFLWALWQI